MVKNKIAIVLPAYNEEKTINKVISELRELLAEDVGFIVVNDCSNDNTSMEARNTGCTVIDLKSNHGYALAVEAGLKRAVDDNYDFAITVDADGQHPPTTVKQVIDLTLTDDWDLVLATRNERPRFGEFVFCFFYKVLLNVPDPLCGLKAYRLSVFQDIGKFETFDSIGTELLTRYCLSKKRVNYEIKMKVRARADAPRFGSGLSVNYRLIKSTFKNIRFLYRNRRSKHAVF